MQVKLLRAIQEKAVRPIGGRDEIPVDVRILSATHKNLGQLVEQGQFRQDLFYRINVIELRVPPLRERRGDVPQLADVHPAGAGRQERRRRSASCRRRRATRWTPTTSPATCASWKTSSSAPWRCATAAISMPTT